MLNKSANNRHTFFLNFAVKKAMAFCVALFVFAAVTNAQPTDDFKTKLTERAKKIVNTLQLTDSSVYNNAVTALVNQYYNLSQVHDAYTAAVKTVKEKNAPKEEADKLIADETAKKAAALKNLHTAFLKQLSAKFTEAQIEKIKDGMTYNVFPITYAAYQKMILSLTNSQKLKIYDWLKEARELAMDEGSSDDKHKMFGKYKGKINNYLSAQGYNVKKEGDEWAKREAAEKKSNQTQN
jgi:Protein of unknown function (DUF3826)